MEKGARGSRRGCSAGVLLVAAMALAPSAHGVISGVPDGDNAYSAVARLGNVNCSAVLVARRVALTSAHCLPQFATGCFPYSPGSLQVRFAQPDGTVDFTQTAARTIDVQSIEVHHDAAVNVQQCATGDPCAGDNLDCSEFNAGVCLDPAQAETPGSVNRSSELVVLFLAAEAPPDVTPLQILVHPTFKNVSDRFVSFAELETWAAQEKPLVTAAGFGTGSEAYSDGVTTLTGRDRGVLRWQSNSSLYGGTLGWQDCTTRAPEIAAPAVVVVPDDITDADAPEATGTGPAWCFAAPGSDVSGAQHSHVSCGDSGGPIVVGAGPGAKGATPTALPPPAPGDTYLQGGRYVAGTASVYAAGIGGRPATAYNPTWTESASSFLTAHLIDSDGDGLVNGVDEFPGCDDDGIDQDLDGVPDECDSCPCDPGDGDEDADGICRVECHGAGDNCWQDFNPGQENCNRVAELQHTPGAIVGDACDPVPCAETVIGDALLEENVVDYHVGSGYSQFWVRCSSYSHDELTVRPLRSHPATGVEAPPVPVPDVATHARFCQRDPSRGILCDDAFALQDARLGESDCAPPASCASVETIDTHWHRMTFTQGGNGANPNAPAPTPDYVHEAGTSVGGSTWVWDYQADWQRWTQNGLIDNAPTPGSLEGVLWLHAGSEVGDTDLTLGTGVHGDQLANHHALDYRPETLRCTSGTTFRAIQTPFFLLLTLPDPPPEVFRRWDAVRGEGSFVVPVGTSDWGAITSRGDAQLVTDRMTGALRRLLGERSLVWANAVEPVAARLGGAALPSAVALAPDGSSLVGGLAVEGGQLDAAEGLAPRTGSPRASGFVPVYTRSRRGVFVVGGRDPETGRSTGEIWFTPIRGTEWRRVRTRVEPASVLAATYSPADDSLYVLDETPRGEARLWVQDAAGGPSALLGRWPRHATWDRHWLVNDAEGSVLLASSSSREERHAIARLTTAASPGRERRVAGILHARRELLLPPLADGAGYTVVTAGAPGWPTEAIAAVTGVRVGRGARIEGDVAVLAGTAGPGGRRRAPGAGLEVEATGRVEGFVTAARVRVERGGNLARGVVRTRRFEGPGGIDAEVVELPALPLPLELPRLPRIGVGTEPVIVRGGESLTLEPGEYGRAVLEDGEGRRPTVLRLSGGRYGFESLDLGSHGALVCDAPCEVSIRGRLRSGSGSRIGPAGAEVPAARVQLFVTGAGAEIGADSRVDARLFVPRGELAIGSGTVARGTFVARAVSLGAGASVTKDEGPIVSDRLETLDLPAGEWSGLGDQL